VGVFVAALRSVRLRASPAAAERLGRPEAMMLQAGVGVAVLLPLWLGAPLWAVGVVAAVWGAALLLHFLTA
jgi:hypothetical protein